MGEVMRPTDLRQAPWVGVGKSVLGSLTAQEAITAAKLDWTVSKRDVYKDSVFGIQKVDKFKAVTRDDDETVLAIMKDTYHPLQNKDAFQFFDKFIGKDMASFDSAGSMKDGKVIWVLANLDRDPVDLGGGDTINKYLLLANGHHGKLSTQVSFCPNRFACGNALARILNRSKRIRIRHSLQGKDNLTEVQDIINAADASFEATAEQYKYLASKQINTKDLEKYVKIIFKTSELNISRSKKMREAITNLFENGAGAHLKSSRGTWWGAYNAISNFLTHESGSVRTTKENRLYSNWFGPAQVKNDEAFSVALVGVD